MATGLATRCSACATVFRVVPDQLRVSEGWVRCGRCSQVFNALEGLVDLETGLPQRATGAGLAPPVNEDAEADFEIAQPAARPGGPALPPPAPPSPAPAPANELRRGPEPDSESPTEARDAPSFVRSADRAARWRRPQVRAALVLLALLAGLGLAAQLSHEYRDLLAAQVPQTRPWLEQACVPLGCTVGAARAIENLAVESSGLVRVEKSSLYRLQVSLRNRATIELAVPALDVTLTDTQGRLVARKVLTLAELGAPQATIAAGRELNVQATVQAQSAGEAATLPIAGYTIDIFYP